MEVNPHILKIFSSIIQKYPSFLYFFADINQAKLDLAKKTADCKTLLATRDARETAGLIESALDGKPDVVFDATCTAPGITTAIYVSKSQIFMKFCVVILKQIQIQIVNLSVLMQWLSPTGIFL